MKTIYFIAGLLCLIFFFMSNIYAIKYILDAAQPSNVFKTFGYLSGFFGFFALTAYLMDKAENYVEPEKPGKNNNTYDSWDLID